MTDGAALAPERILDAAEDVLRRYGPAKATVLDVARALGVSHGSVYRHFPSKAALRDAVVERWLGRVAAPLHAIALSGGPAAPRLRAWVAALIQAKRAKVQGEPELFATYHALAGEARDVVRRHLDALVAQLAAIIADGVRDGAFAAPDPAAAARALLYATARFHDPTHAAEWADPGVDATFEAVWALLLRGLQAR